MKFVRIRNYENKRWMILVLIVVAQISVTACSSEESSVDTNETTGEVSTETSSTASDATCESIDKSIFCVSVNGADKTLYEHTEDVDSPLLANPYITARFQTAGGVTFTQVLYDITPTSFIKGVSVVFSGVSVGTYVMDGSGNFSVFTLAADQSWVFAPGFSTGAIDITKYGEVGGFIAGTYSAILCDVSNATVDGSDCNNPAYLINITGNFNIKREANL